MRIIPAIFFSLALNVLVGLSVLVLPLQRLVDMHGTHYKQFRGAALILFISLSVHLYRHIRAWRFIATIVFVLSIAATSVGLYRASHFGPISWVVFNAFAIVGYVASIWSIVRLGWTGKAVPGVVQTIVPPDALPPAAPGPRMN